MREYKVHAFQYIGREVLMLAKTLHLKDSTIYELEHGIPLCAKYANDECTVFTGLDLEGNLIVKIAGKELKKKIPSEDWSMSLDPFSRKHLVPFMKDAFKVVDVSMLDPMWGGIKQVNNAVPS